jgi:hypothetical protein
MQGIQSILMGKDEALLRIEVFFAVNLQQQHLYERLFFQIG